MVERVIVAIDFSAASASAVAVARHHHPDAHKLLLHVLKPSEASKSNSAKDKARARLEEWASEGETVEIGVGSPAEEISRQANAWNAEIIVMGTRGRSQIANMLTGSATEWLIRNARLPVLVVHDIPLSDAMKQKVPPKGSAG